MKNIKTWKSRSRDKSNKSARSRRSARNSGKRRFSYLSGNTNFVVPTMTSETPSVMHPFMIANNVDAHRRLVTVGELAITLAHEINQPLAAIASYGEACLQQLQRDIPEPEKLRHNLEQIAMQAQRAGRVIRELRSFLTNGKVAREPVDINSLIRTTCMLIAPHAQAHRVALDVSLAESLPPAMSTRMHLEQVLLNLLQNAIEAIRDAEMPSGTIQIETCAIAGDALQITLRDSGPGLDQTIIERIFEPFYTTKSEGLGVGLTISRSLIESHGGRLWVDPGGERGAVFHFTLPVMQ